MSAFDRACKSVKEHKQHFSKASQLEGKKMKRAAYYAAKQWASECTDPDLKEELQRLGYGIYERQIEPQGELSTTRVRASGGKVQDNKGHVQSSSRKQTKIERKGLFGKKGRK